MGRGGVSAFFLLSIFLAPLRTLAVTSRPILVSGDGQRGRGVVKPDCWVESRTDD